MKMFCCTVPVIATAANETKYVNGSSTTDSERRSASRIDATRVFSRNGGSTPCASTMRSNTCRGSIPASVVYFAPTTRGRHALGKTRAAKRGQIEARGLLRSPVREPVEDHADARIEARGQRGCRGHVQAHDEVLIAHQRNRRVDEVGAPALVEALQRVECGSRRVARHATVGNALRFRREAAERRLDEIFLVADEQLQPPRFIEVVAVVRRRAESRRRQR